jgi:hypothetical protein
MTGPTEVMSFRCTPADRARYEEAAAKANRPVPEWLRLAAGAALDERPANPADRILWNSGREEVDEIVVHNVMVHLEQMSDQGWWMGIYRDGHALTVNFSTKGRSPITATCQDEGEKPWPWDEAEDHGA